MESNINHQVINSYSKTFAEKLIDGFFKDKSSIKGAEIKEFSEIKQLNYFVLKILFETWKTELDKLKSPYFDFKNKEVQKALNTFMNVLSKNILVSREEFRILLEEATYKTILLIFSPYEYYLQEINKPTYQKISINDLYAIQKYVKINGHLLQAYIDRFNSEGIQAVFNDDAVRIFDEVCETIKETPEDFDAYHHKFSDVLILDLDKVYSNTDSILNDQVEEIHEPDNINEKFKTQKPTLLETLGVEKKEAITDIHEEKSSKGLKKSITINQRFMFENELFNGDKDEFEMVINYLENCTANQEAMEFINENYVEKKNWDLEKEEVIEFFSVINKRFPK
jgi:hypothetical protein